MNPNIGACADPTVQAENSTFKAMRISVGMRPFRPFGAVERNGIFRRLRRFGKSAARCQWTHSLYSLRASEAQRLSFPLLQPHGVAIRLACERICDLPSNSTKIATEKDTPLNIGFRSTKLRKVFESEAKLKRKYGARMMSVIMARMDILRTSLCLADVPAKPPSRCHQLSTNRDEQFAVDLVHPFRLVFEVKHEPIPRLENGGIDKDNVTEIEIVEIVDYHGR